LGGDARRLQAEPWNALEHQAAETQTTVATPTVNRPGDGTDPFRETVLSDTLCAELCMVA